MDLYNQKIAEYNIKRQELVRIHQGIIECYPMYNSMARELCPDLFEVPTNETAEYTWLNKMIKKYETDVPKLPGAFFPGNGTLDGFRSVCSIVDEANIELYKHVQRIVDRYRKRRSELKKARKNARK